MPWPEVKCNLNYKDKCPGIIYKKDFADFRKKYKCRAPKGRKEVGSSGVCSTCANAERSGVGNARLRDEIRSSDAGQQAGTAPTVSGSLGPSAGGVKGGGGDGGSGREDGSGGKGSGEVGSEDGTGGESDRGDTVSATNPDALGAGGEQCSSSKGGGGPMYSLVASQGSIGSIPMCTEVSGKGGGKDGSGREDGSGGKGSGEHGSEDGTGGEGGGEDVRLHGNGEGGGLRYGIGGQMYSLAASQGSIGSIPMCTKKKENRKRKSAFLAIAMMNKGIALINISRNMIVALCNINITTKSNIIAPIVFLH